MDKESIAVSVAYQEMENQHFNGGYFSSAVRTKAECFNELSEQEKQNLFAEIFNDTYALAEKIRSHPRFNSKTNELDLSKEGLGVIGISLYYFSAEEAKAEGDKPVKGIRVMTAFAPTPRKTERWIRPDHDPMGLYTNEQTMITLDNEPQHWEEHVFAGLDGAYDDGEPDNINYDLMRLLDAKETLEVLDKALS